MSVSYLNLFKQTTVLLVCSVHSSFKAFYGLFKFHNDIFDEQHITDVALMHDYSLVLLLHFWPLASPVDVSDTFSSPPLIFLYTFFKDRTKLQVQVEPIMLLALLNSFVSHWGIKTTNTSGTVLRFLPFFQLPQVPFVHLMPQCCM